MNFHLILSLACADINKFPVHSLVIWTDIFGRSSGYFRSRLLLSASRYKRVSFVSILFLRQIDIYERDHKHVSSQGQDS
ncbi:hypothetical protein C3432_04180 [Citrobacter amalonaticus]|uniref:Uncharacterized protein n=1 Tax=Citrobacter amalonaticus TaxID=35703 RepID=A0A2S4S3R6_CITAM|nr:hypothetical protein C3432_04180 [Citrobacter amalonaticus]POT78041.1 hypothetical protein C3436_11850 [Citrobacter amalonaticus]POU68493.1 hypothetical protein C3430_05385 [Citrobacter amalonaticus]POV08096.1 hypothetical protein C3424_05395 [Citrobacter amalonaticus]